VTYFTSMLPQLGIFKLRELFELHTAMVSELTA